MLSQQSQQTQNNFYSLFNFQEARQLKASNFNITQILIVKSDDYQLLADMFFFVYSTSREREVMNQEDFKLFDKQLKEHQLDFQNKKKRPERDSKGKIEVSKIFFRQIFQQYDMKSIKSLFRFNLKDQQRKFQSQLQRKGIDKKQGDMVYLIQIQWFLKWKSYMQYKYGITIQIKQNQQTIQKQKNNRMLAILEQNQHIVKASKKLASQLENQDFLEPINNNIIKGQQNNELKQNLAQYQHFISVNAEIWKKLHMLYGGGPKIFKPFRSFYIKKLVLTKFDHKKQNFTFDFAVGLAYNPQQNFQTIFNSRKQKGKFFSDQNVEDMIVYYKYPGNLQWKKIQNLKKNLQQYPFHYKTFVVYINKDMANRFQQKFNIIEFKGKKMIQQRVRNFGNSLTFQEQGVLQQGHVGNIQNKDSIIVYVKNFEGRYIKIQKNYKQLSKLNPQVLEQQVLQGLAGFQNIGNSCYINAPLQCILRAPYFGQYLQSLQLGRGKESLLTYQLQLLYEKIKQSRDSTEMTHFKRKFDDKFPFFQGSAQHDAQQFLLLLLDQISEQKPESVVSTIQQNNISKNKKILDFFAGKTESETQCKKCHNKGHSVQSFFTHSLSLPIIDETSFSFFFVDSNYKVWKYCITIGKDISIGELIQKVQKQLKITQKNLLIMSVFQNQWMNNIYKLNPSHNKIATLENYDTNVVCYYINQFESPDYQDFAQQKKDDNTSVKIQLRNRKYNSATRSFEAFYLPFIIQINSTIKGKQLKDIICKQLQRYVDESQYQKYLKKAQDKTQEEKNLNITFAHSKTKQKTLSQSQNQDNQNKNQLKTDQNPFQIRYLKSESNLRSLCWFCKKKIQDNKQQKDQKTFCFGCEFEQDEILYSNKNFIKNWQNLVIGIDWKSQSYIKNFKAEQTKSCEQAFKLQIKRRSHIQKLLKQSCQQVQSIELKCQNKQCHNNQALRKQKIIQSPNILILHLKRFEYRDNCFYKLKNKVDVVQNFILPQTSDKYQLYGNVVHYGNGAGRGGHYINYIKVNNIWFKCDDEKVFRIKQQNQFLNPDTYLLFYKKKSMDKKYGLINQ